MSVPHDRVSASEHHGELVHFNALDWIAMVLMIIGGINWGLVGGFNLDLVARLFGEMSTVSRAVYILVGLASLYGLAVLGKMARSR